MPTLLQTYEAQKALKKQEEDALVAILQAETQDTTSKINYIKARAFQDIWELEGKKIGKYICSVREEADLIKLIMINESRVYRGTFNLRIEVFVKQKIKYIGLYCEDTNIRYAVLELESNDVFYQRFDNLYPGFQKDIANLLIQLTEK